MRKFTDTGCLPFTTAFKLCEFDLDWLDYGNNGVIGCQMHI